jgi:hypothetical protein
MQRLERHYTHKAYVVVKGNPLRRQEGISFSGITNKTNRLQEPLQARQTWYGVQKKSHKRPAQKE